jgi:hypothetical protein
VGVSPVVGGGVVEVGAGSAGFSVPAGVGVGCEASSLGVGVVAAAAGAAGVVCCGSAVAVAGSWLVSVVTCVTGGDTGLTGGDTAATGTEVGGSVATGTAVLAFAPGWRRPVRWVTAATDSGGRAAELIGWGVSRTTTGIAAGRAADTRAVLTEVVGWWRVP